MSKIKNSGLDRYGAKPLEQQQLGPAGVEGVNIKGVAGDGCLKTCSVEVAWPILPDFSRNLCLYAADNIPSTTHVC